MNKYFFSNHIFLLFVLTIFANKVLSSDLQQSCIEANVIPKINQASQVFLDSQSDIQSIEYEWKDDKGIIQSAKTTISPFRLTISLRDKSSLDEIIKNLDDIDKIDNKTLPIMCHLFDKIDDSNCAPISFDLQLRYKQIPWHLLHLNYWIFSCDNNLNKEVLKEFLATSNLNGDINGKTSIQQMFTKTSELKELNENDLKGIKILQPFWEYRYVDNVLTDLSRRIKSILSYGDSEVLSEQAKIAILRFLQVIGEYCSKLKHVTFFSELNTEMDCEGFRNRLSHLENPKYTMNELFKNDDILWLKIIKELQSLKPLLDTYGTEWRAPNKIEDNSDKWQSIKSGVLKKDLPTQIKNDSFTNIKILRAKFSQILKQKIEKSNSLSDLDIKNISLRLTPYSPETRLIIEENKNSKKQTDELNNLIMKAINFKPPSYTELDKILNSKAPNISPEQKKQLLETAKNLRDFMIKAITFESQSNEESAEIIKFTELEKIDIQSMKKNEILEIAEKVKGYIIKAAIFKPPLDKELDKILDSTNKNISTTQKKEFLEIVEEPNSNERNKKVKNFIGKLYPLKKLVVTERIENLEKVQKKIEQSLRTKIDIRQECQLHEYVKFITEQMHKECERKLDDESFWSPTPSYFEVIFAKMRHEPVDTINRKKEYRLSLMKQSLNTLDWIREKLNLSDITLTDELSNLRHYTPLDAEQLPTLIINNQLHFNNFRASISIDRLNHHIQELPVFLYTIEFYIGLAYESLRPIFHFPEFANHYLKNLAIRNYYDHPDPTHLMPLTIWNSEGKLDSSNGRKIYIRPDRNDAYNIVLVNEIARICVPLHHVISTIHNELQKKILHSYFEILTNEQESKVQRDLAYYHILTIMEIPSEKHSLLQ